MLKPKYYIICHCPDNKKDTGYLFLISKGRKNRKRKALGIPISLKKFEDNWNEREQKFKSGLENYKQINKQIETAIENFTKETGEIKEMKEPISVVNKQSFLKYWESIIETDITKIGSKVKHSSLYGFFLLLSYCNLALNLRFSKNSVLSLIDL